MTNNTPSEGTRLINYHRAAARACWRGSFEVKNRALAVAMLEALRVHYAIVYEAEMAKKKGNRDD